MEHKNSLGKSYFLHATKVTLRGSKKEMRIFYFAKEKNPAKALNDIPPGYKIIENPRTHLPILKKS